MSLETQIARLHADLDKIEELRSTSAGPCTACRFYGWETAGAMFGPVCRNPLVTPPVFDPTRHEIKQGCKPVNAVRGQYGDCGPTGILFRLPDPKPAPEPRRTFWQRIFP